ncbi:MAG: cytochrome c [Thiocapsa sp.]|nr:c-type cytochrome [Thiocapsa sp.]MCG6898303.1 cytochrome c [Thiocapsa sp.]MCG6984875.1 cytochrome c [Thiocapsa sp.]
MRSSIVRALALSLALAAPLAVSPSATASASETEPDPDLGERLHRQCALCHGLYSQGILGGKYPRLAGFPDYYLLKSLNDYRDGEREHAAMVVVGGLRTLSDHDVASLAAYIASIDLNEVHPLDVPTPDGADVENGEDLYRSDCKTCHGRSAEGIKRKESPQLAGQYDGYLLRQIGRFKEGKRMHANDPEDETFVDYSDQEILDIVGFVTTLDDQD